MTTVRCKPSGISLWRFGSASMIRHWIFPLWARRDHPSYQHYIEEMERTQFATPTALASLQLKRLRKLLRHARENCPFYRKRMDQVGFDIGKFRSLDQLPLLPVLTKRDIQEHGKEMEALNFPEMLRLRNQTGGSTGSPLQFYVDKERYGSRLASTVRHNRWAGLCPGDWHAVLWGSRLDQSGMQGWRNWLRNTFLYRAIFLNTSCIQERDWTVFISKLRAKRPRVLLAYTQAAVLFARYLLESRIKDIHFDAVITTAELLLPGQREFLEQTFGGRVFNRYGCREMSVIASDCEFHRGMHVGAETLVLEIVPHETVPKPAGKVVITDLLNYSMPLIRYEVGDVAAWAEDQNCACGRHLPLLTEVQGRTTDFLVLSDGRHISGPALTLVVADMPHVRQVQFVQKTLDQIVLRVVPGRGYGPQTADELRRRLGIYLGSPTVLTIEETRSIVSEVSGKYRFTINEVTAQSMPESAPGQTEEHLASC